MSRTVTLADVEQALYRQRILRVIAGADCVIPAQARDPWAGYKPEHFEIQWWYSRHEWKYEEPGECRLEEYLDSYHRWYATHVYKLPEQR